MRSQASCRCAMLTDMDEYSSAKHWADAAMDLLQEDFDAALAAFRRVQAAHHAGSSAPELVAAFRARAEQVHLDAESAHAAHDGVRRALVKDAGDLRHLH